MFFRITAGWMVILGLLAGCTVGNTTIATALPSVTPPTFIPTVSLPTLTPTTMHPVVTPAPACLEAEGRVERTVLTIPQQPKPMAVRVYLPPCYDPGHAGGYPVLFLFHGQNYTEDQWEKLGVTTAADELISSGAAAPFLMVMPQEVYWRVPPVDSNYESVVLEALIPWVEETYAVCDLRECRAVGGLSRGAGWALRLGMLHPDVFSTVGLHSPVVFYGDATRLPRWLAAIPDGLQPRVWLDYGRSDPEALATEALEKILADARLPHEYYRNVGGHDAKYWSAHVEEYLRWYAQAWKVEPD